ncbi:Na+/H+ antiporter subunit E [Salinibaculum rarum]|uniref:Na+/H+ antiporter subunit E n=1 Tax=Salinibaculum rarum TaxID=3058903 RepID=UPI00265F8679|nr:Na+/H+ antiporter subunit E [Salinibaculum sp. KK48]
MNARRWVVAGVAFAVLWVLVNGATLTPTSLAGTFLVGLAVGMPVAFIFRRLYEEEFDVTRLVSAAPAVVAYTLLFAREIVVANIDVTYRVLAPRMPIEPQVIYIPLRVETDLGVTTIANSITITPGTITLDHDPDENALYVHIIDGRDPEAVVEPIRQWEDYALTIFDEDRSPGDTPPEIRVHPPDYPPEPKTVTTQERQMRDTTPATTAEDGDERPNTGDEHDGGAEDGR